MNHTNRTPTETTDLAGRLAGRFGPLALSRAAGQAAAAERTGDMERRALWHEVIACLRQTLVTAQANGTA